MTELHYNHRALEIMPGESVLDCLLRHDVNYPHACRSGICQACLIKAGDSPIAPEWQEGLPETLKSQGYFLACQAKPQHMLHLKDVDAAECEQEAMITELYPLTHNVICMKLLTGQLERWIPGQYLTLTNPDGLSRSYSIANIPSEDGCIELHIKLTEDGKMSQWLRATATVDTTVTIRGPFGKCYYLNPDNAAFDMLLIGTGTGLAPLLAIVKMALRERHTGKITLIHGGLQDGDIYYAEALLALASLHENFSYFPCVLKSEGLYPEADIFDKAASCLSSDIKNTHAYVCGPKATTQQLKTRLFLAGVPSANLFSDAFL